MTFVSRFGVMVVVSLSSLAFAGPQQDCSSAAFVNAAKALDPAVSGSCSTDATDQDLGVNLRLAEVPADLGPLSPADVDLWKTLVLPSARTALEKYRGLVSTLALHDVTSGSSTRRAEAARPRPGPSSCSRRWGCSRTGADVVRGAEGR